MRLLEYRRKTLEELFSEYAKKENQSVVVNEVYARIKDTFEMLDRFPSEVDQHYRLFVDLESNSKRPAAEIFGVTLSCDAHELKQELEDSTEKVDLLISKFKELKQVAEPILTQMKAGAEMGMGYKVSAESIKKAVKKFHVPEKVQVDVPSSTEEGTEDDMLERMQSLGQLSETELYRLAADELEGKGIHPEAVSAVYIYEVKQLPGIVHTGREKIHARLKACMKLSQMLLEDGYVREAVDNIEKFTRVMRITPKI